MSKKYFQQINFTLPDFSLEQLKGKEIDSQTDGTVGFFYYSIADSEVLEYIKKHSPIPNPFVAYSEIIGTILPHIDAGGTCVINHYLETNTADTIFYNSKDNSNPIVLSNGAKIFQESDCREVARFHAEPKSTWILNIGKIHNVTQPITGVRRTISIGYPGVKYSQLLKLISGD